jgi:hypothetical protein
MTTHTSFDRKSRSKWPLITAFALMTVLAANLAEAQFRGRPIGSVAESVTIVPYLNSVGDVLLTAQ